MELQTFFDNFEVMAEAPNGVEELRSLVLQLAVSGKVATQNIDEGHGRDLLRKIGATAANVGEDFELPSNWGACKLKDFAELIMGQSPPSKSYNDSGEGMPFFQGKSEFGNLYPTPRKWCTAPNKIAKPDDVLISVRAPVGPTNFCNIECCIGRGLAAIRINEYSDFKFLRIVLQAYEDKLASQSTGTTFKAISKKHLQSFIVPVPPLEEQKRIVAKVDQLMALCDELEEKKEKRNKYRVRANEASLDKLLNAQEPEEFEEHWQRVVENFEVIAEAPNGVEELRTLVVELAMQGKLVEQLLDEVPSKVEETYEFPKKAAHHAPIQNFEKDDLPGSWKLAPMICCATLVNGRAYKRNEMLSQGVPIIRIQNLNGGENWYYSDLDLPEEKYCDSGDLLFAWSATFGPYHWNRGRAIYHYHIWKVVLSEHLDRDFMFYVLLNITNHVKAQSHGLAMLHMTKIKMEQFLIPVPPLEEQKRIVAKVDQLMALCDELEQKLQKKMDTSRCYSSSLTDSLGKMYG